MSRVDMLTPAVQSVQTAECFDFSLHSRRRSRDIAAQRRMRHDTSRDAINDETGNKTLLVYRNQTRPPGPSPKMWLGACDVCFLAASMNHSNPLIAARHSPVIHLSDQYQGARLCIVRKSTWLSSIVPRSSLQTYTPSKYLFSDGTEHDP